MEAEPGTWNVNSCALSFGLGLGFVVEGVRAVNVTRCTYQNLGTGILASPGSSSPPFNSTLASRARAINLRPTAFQSFLFSPNPEGDVNVVIVIRRLRACVVDSLRLVAQA
jgi:hypothetical protein